LSQAKESLGYCETRKHEPRFNEGCSELLEERKQAILQWLQDPSEIIWDNLSDVIREARRQFKQKRLNICKTNLVTLQRKVRTRTSETCMTLSGATNLKYLAKNETVNLLADSYILRRWKGYVSQLLNAHVSDAGQIEIRKAEPFSTWS
jgi:hypothetical protein